ncbi:transposase [Eubacterium barkeri]|uniref:Transposase n=1 Tax=Eubacterium barkeri TaxID=1528 RepID=A0A1H3JJ75_EUBBA|nr:transposase [Eubacterium barkeri]
MTKPRRNHTDEFKKQIVELYNNGKTRVEIMREYELSSSVLSNWIKRYNTSGSFNIDDNRRAEDKELIKLRKENQQLRMENDILYPKGHAKQAALIMGRK